MDFTNAREHEPHDEVVKDAFTFLDDWESGIPRDVLLPLSMDSQPWFLNSRSIENVAIGSGEI
ncbi:hypothetical protein F442_08285 [Phytophthora nicotianae P10297]|uniref:Uncharacterized protein n=4 Tax=Phytophthora nicotianae TaxID=4792 RepID=V9F7D7_PHYNI|nr:hypothetical protein F443_08343 [Phytophthora nicotianae P1569]ETM47156.1 hypothetical protein L914_08061 [Phytophthora nicotianae]ETO76118.1 hypothetical protein F444_08402 [Phytophthora nicotianae P1976]ETP45243.1 hypothetical protein F442_08285 [Phytophthora nicotianae P10297]